MTKINEDDGLKIITWSLKREKTLTGRAPVVRNLFTVLHNDHMTPNY